MIRTVKLDSYIPDYLHEYPQMMGVQAGMNREVQDLEDETQVLFDNQFIQSADERGIGLFERMLDISPLDNDTLENRQFRVLSLWNRYIPYTKITLNRKLEILCGPGRYTAVFDGERKTLTVRVSLKSRRNMDQVERLLEDMVPLDVVIDLSLLFNQHELIGKMTHFRLSRFTHGELRNGIIELGENGRYVKMTHGQLKKYAHDTIRKGVI